MNDPVMICPRCKLVVEVDSVALRPGTEHEHWLACPRCFLEMRSSEWDVTVRERPGQHLAQFDDGFGYPSGS